MFWTLIKTLWGGCLLLPLLLRLLLEPLPGVHQLRTQDDISVFFVLLVELQQFEIQYNTIDQTIANIQVSVFMFA